MPARGRHLPTTHKSVEHYVNRIQTSHPYQEMLKQQLLEIFGQDEEESILLSWIRQEINHRLFVSKKVFPNPTVYRYPREALESIGVQVKVVVTDKTSVSFVAKKFIAPIWQNAGDKIKSYSLLLEYHNLRQMVVNSNK